MLAQVTSLCKYFFILSLLCKAKDLVRLWKPSLAVCAGGMPLLWVNCANSRAQHIFIYNIFLQFQFMLLVLIYLMECSSKCYLWRKKEKGVSASKRVLQKESNAIILSEMNLLEPNGLKLMGIFASKISKSGQLWKMDIVPQKSAVLCFN